MAVQKLESAAPRIADYPPIRDYFGEVPRYLAFERAQAEHMARVAKVRQVIEDVVQLGIHVANQAHKGR